MVMAFVWGFIGLLVVYAAALVPTHVAYERNHNKANLIQFLTILVPLAGIISTMWSDEILWGAVSAFTIGLVLSLWAWLGSDVHDKTLPYVPDPSPGLDDAPRVVTEPAAPQRTERTGLLVSISVLKGTHPPFTAGVQDVFFEDVERGKQFAKDNEAILVGKTKVFIGV